jgi:hypothetical protein
MIIPEVVQMINGLNLILINIERILGMGGSESLPPEQKPHSWRYNFVEVSGHNLESSQTWGFCMDFLNEREGGMVFYPVFLRSPL